MRVLGFWLNDVAFACAAAFLAGIAAAGVGAPFAALFWATAAAASGVLVLFRRCRPWKLLLLLILTACAGIWYFHIYANIVAVRTHLVFGQKVSFSALVTGEPKPAASGKYLVVPAETQAPYAGAITILAPVGEAIAYGDLLHMQAEILPPSDTGAPLVLPAALELEAHGRGVWLWQKLFAFRAWLVRGVRGLLPPEAAGFVAAVAFSAKGELTPDVSAAMAASGTGFLATLYGMKIALLMFGVTNALLGYLDRRLVVGLAAGAGVGFVLMAGAPVAAMRAAIMALIGLWARERGGVLLRRNALAFTACGLALWNPTVLGDMGFLSSFGSVAGVLYLAPALARAFRFKGRGFGGWKENVVMNLAAQLGILPLIAGASAGFPLISFISGAVLILFLPFTVLVGWLAALAAALPSSVSFFMSQLAVIVPDIQLALIRFFAGLSFPVALPFGNRFADTLYYGLLVWFAAHYRHEKT